VIEPVEIKPGLDIRVKHGNVRLTVDT